MTELKSISVKCYEDFDGEFVTTSKGCGSKNHPHDSKFSIMLAVPRSDEECQELYNCDREYFVKKGLILAAYDETAVTNMIREKIIHGEDPVSEEFIEAVKTGMENEMLYDPDKKVRATGEKKALDDDLKALRKDYGMSYTDIREKIAEISRLKAEEVK